MTRTLQTPRGGDDRPPGRHEVELPQGVSAADWALERVRVQNPSIRTYLGCIRLLEEVLDSNYAILHCSPERLLKIWRQVDEVGRLMRSDLLPTLEQPSVVPGLDVARRHARDSFRELGETVFTAMERCEHPLRADQLPEVRKLLCIWIGKVYAFLRDTFGEVVASDPRSRHDADYFLSKRFAQDIEESEWLYSSVYELDDLVDGLEKACSAQFEEILPRMRKERMIPSETEWEQVRKILDTLQGDLTPRLREVLSLRGIRLNDLESLEAHAWMIPTDCRSIREVYAVGREVIEQLKAVCGPSVEERHQRVRDLTTCHRIVGARMTDLIGGVHASLRGLATDLASARAGIEKRRALMLAKDLVEFGPRPARSRRTGGGTG